MPRHPKPWFRKGRGWYIQRDGKKVFLGRDRKEAYQEYHRTMQVPATRVVRSNSLAVIVDAFLEWVQTNRAPDTPE